MFIRKSTHETVVKELNEGHRAEVAALNATIARLTSGGDADRATIDVLDKTARKFRADLVAVRATLAEIAALETPGCAHVGKKMAALARKALPGEATEPKKAAA